MENKLEKLSNIKLKQGRVERKIVLNIVEFFKSHHTHIFLKQAEMDKEQITSENLSHYSIQNLKKKIYILTKREISKLSEESFEINLSAICTKVWLELNLKFSTRMRFNKPKRRCLSSTQLFSYFQNSTSLYYVKKNKENIAYFINEESNFYSKQSFKNKIISGLIKRGLKLKAAIFF